MSRVLVMVVGFIFFGAHFEANAFNPKKKLTLTGSSTVAPLVLEIARQFERENAGTRVDVQTGGSSRGIADSRKGLADLGMASRDLKSTEGDLSAFPIAIDGVAAIVHRENPISNLTDAQLKEIFLGNITNWNQLSGADLEIVVVNRAEGRSELEIFTKRYSIRPSQIKAKLIVGENAHSVKTIARNKKAITYMSIGHALREAKAGVPIKLLALNGVAPTLENVQSGEFPLSRPLNLIAKDASPESLKFVEFAQSKKVAEIVKRQSFIPVSN